MLEFSSLNPRNRLTLLRTPPRGLDSQYRSNMRCPLTIRFCKGDMLRNSLTSSITSRLTSWEMLSKPKKGRIKRLKKREQDRKKRIYSVEGNLSNSRG